MCREPMSFILHPSSFGYGFFLHGGHGGHALSDNLLTLLPVAVVAVAVAGARLRAWLRSHGETGDAPADRHGDEPI